jgi:uncharacterized protein
MKQIIVVSDTTAITHLARIGALDLLHRLYIKIYIPEAVYQELTSHGQNIPGAKEVLSCSWINTKKITNREKVIFLSSFLDPGESEAIALAQEINADLLIMDERKGRAQAKTMGLNITGMIGILVFAKEKGLISEIRPFLDKLIATKFKLGMNLYHQALSLAGEETQIKKA